jgi:hypothetical protein
VRLLRSFPLQACLLGALVQTVMSVLIPNIYSFFSKFAVPN